MATLTQEDKLRQAISYLNEALTVSAKFSGATIEAAIAFNQVRFGYGDDMAKALYTMAGSLKGD